MSRDLQCDRSVGLVVIRRDLAGQSWFPGGELHPRKTIKSFSSTPPRKSDILHDSSVPQASNMCMCVYATSVNREKGVYLSVLAAPLLLGLSDVAHLVVELLRLIHKTCAHVGLIGPCRQATSTQSDRKLRADHASFFWPLSHLRLGRVRGQVASPVFCCLAFF